MWLLQLGATLIIFILYSRFLAKFILHLCSNTFVCTLPSWEICWCSLSCSWWSDPWLAFLNFGFLPVTVYSLIRGSFTRVFLSGFLTSLCFLVSKSLTNWLFTICMCLTDHDKFMLGSFVCCWSIFWNITFLVVAKVTCMEPRALHSTSEMDSIISILPSSLLFCSWGLYHLQERNMLQIYW